MTFMVDEAFARVKVLAKRLVVVNVLETTRFVKGWVKLDEFMLLKVFP